MLQAVTSARSWLLIGEAAGIRASCKFSLAWKIMKTTYRPSAGDETPP